MDGPSLSPYSLRHDHAKLAACVPTTGLSGSPGAPRRAGLASGQGAAPSRDGDAPRPEGERGDGRAAARGVPARRLPASVDRGPRSRQRSPGGSRRRAASLRRAAPTSPRVVAAGRRPFAISAGGFSKGILRKEVIQPQVPLRLPCYDLVPITGFTFGACLAAPATSDAPRFGGLTGGVYKAQEHIHRGMLIRDY